MRYGCPDSQLCNHIPSSTIDRSADRRMAGNFCSLLIKSVQGEAARSYLIWTELCEYSIFALSFLYIPSWYWHTLCCDCLLTHRIATRILHPDASWNLAYWDRGLWDYLQRLHSPPIARSWNAFGAAIRSQSTLSLDLIELMVRRFFPHVMSNSHTPYARTDLQSRCPKRSRICLVS